MTGDECFDAAAARCGEFGVKVPGTRTTAYARINARQQQLFARVARLEPELFGRTQVCVLTAGSYDLSLLDPLSERITHVEVMDVGTSNYAVGTPVRIVPVHQQDAELPPRATIRDAVLTQVGTDLDLVVSIRIHYSRRPTVVNTGDTLLEFIEQFEELLVIDLAKMMVRKAIAIDAGEGAGKGALEYLTTEERELNRDMERHCEHWRFAESARFSHSQVAQPEPTA